MDVDGAVTVVVELLEAVVAVVCGEGLYVVEPANCRGSGSGGRQAVEVVVVVVVAVAVVEVEVSWQRRW